MENRAIGLVLSGGGYRGAAQAGAIKAFEEFSIFPDSISGSSAGALVGALYAADYSPIEILGFFKKIKLFGFSRYALRKPGLINTASFKDILMEYLPHDSFDGLSKKLYVTATNLVKGRAEVFENGSLTLSILASVSFPGIFTPVTIGEGLYADGGVMDNFPVKPLNGCHQIYGVEVSPVTTVNIKKFKSVYQVINRAFHLRLHQDSEAKFHHCKLVVQPEELSQYNIFNSGHLEDYFNLGYASTIQELKKKSVECLG